MRAGDPFKPGFGWSGAVRAAFTLETRPRIPPAGAEP